MRVLVTNASFSPRGSCFSFHSRESAADLLRARRDQTSSIGRRERVYRAPLPEL